MSFVFTLYFCKRITNLGTRDMILQFKVKNFLSIRVFAFPSWVLFMDPTHLARATSSKLWLGSFFIWLQVVPRNLVRALG